MKRTLLTIFASTLLLSAAAANAFVRYEEKKPENFYSVKMTGYADYAPFGYIDNPRRMSGSFHTIFQPLLDALVKDTEVKIQYVPYSPDVDSWAQQIREGKIDFMIGAYNQSEVFKGLYLLYPAPIHNPITVFMLPNRIAEVKSTDDLKKLKGVRNTQEIFSDFVEKQIEPFELIEVDSAYAMFEKLFTRQADYILTSYYYGLYESIKLGLRHQIAPAKQSLWRIPMFVAVSKTSRRKDTLAKRMTRYLNDKKNIELVQQALEQMMSEVEEKYNGVVPPTFGVENMPESTKDDQKPSTKAPDWVSQTDLPKDALPAEALENTPSTLEKSAPHP